MLKALSRKWNRHKMQVLAFIFCLPLYLFSSLSSAKTVQDIKAAYLYNFIKFISWPEANDQTEFNLCVLGDDPLNEKLKMLDARPIRQQSLHVKHITSMKTDTNCQVLFVGESEKKFIDNIVQHYSERSTLTVSSVDDFVVRGGMIGFITLGNIIRFDINLKQARQTHLSISSKLLELANRVEK